MGTGTGRSQNNTINNSSNISIDSRRRWQQPSSSYILWNSFSRNRTSGITATTSTLWSPFRMAIVFLLCCCCFFWPISAAIIFNSEEEPGIRCFCDKQTCGSGTLVCSGKYCLIGVRTDDNGRGRLDQHCVDEQILPAKTCAKDWKKWSEVCICEENLCNTFAFLRSQIDDNHHDEHGHRQHQPSALFPNSQHDGMAQRGASGSYHHSMQQQHDGDDHIDGGGDGHNWLGSSSRGNRDPRRDHSSRNDGNGGYQFQPSRGAAPLVLLLVVLPLVVGAFTVFLVFLNYHCKML